MLSRSEKKIVFDKLGYVPSAQQAAIHFDPALVKLVSGGERAGKSVFASKELVGNSPNGSLFWIVGADYEQARPEFLYAFDDLNKLGAIEGRPLIPSMGKCSMRLRGGIEIETKSGEDAVKLASKAPSGILMVEAGQQPFQNFEKLHMRTAEARSRGEGWLLLIGTAEKSQRVVPRAIRELPECEPLRREIVFPADVSNLMVFPSGEQNPELLRQKASIALDLYMERFSRDRRRSGHSRAVGS